MDRELTFCDVKIPKSGKNLFKLNGLEFFFRDLKRITYVYETSTGVLVMVTFKERQEILEYILKRIEEVKRYVTTRN